MVGAGVVGLTTAYELSRKGYRVTVIERRADVAQAASYANAGTLNGSMRELMASPQNFKRAVSHFLGWSKRATTPQERLPHQASAATPAEDDHRRVRDSAAQADSLEEEQLRAVRAAVEAETSAESAVTSGEHTGQPVAGPSGEDEGLLAAAGTTVEAFRQEAVAKVEELASEVGETAAAQLAKLQEFLEEFKVLRVSPSILSAINFWRWGANFGLMCMWGYETRRLDADKLVTTSLTVLSETVKREDSLSFHLQKCGSLRVFLDEAQFAEEKAEIERLELPNLEVLSPEAAIEREPSLAALRFVGAVANPDDRLGDCHEFCTQLASLCKQRGVRFRTAMQADRVVTAHGRAVGVALHPTRPDWYRKKSRRERHAERRARHRTEHEARVEIARRAATGEPEGEGDDYSDTDDPAGALAAVAAAAVASPLEEVIACDAVVVSCGADSYRVLPGMSTRLPWLPVVPVRGYSLTGPASPDPKDCPAGYVLLEEPLHAIVSRFGDRVRVTSHAEISMAMEPEPARTSDLWNTVDLFFPRAFSDRSEAEAWMGRRPMTSDSLPIVGVGPLPNVMLNTGHGAHGWRLAHATARLVADMFASDAPPFVPLLTPRRFPIL